MARRKDKHAALQELVPCLYEAAVMPELWPSALDKFHELFDSLAAHFFVWDRNLDRPTTSHRSTNFEGGERALNYYLRIDPRRVLVMGQKVNEIFRCHEHIDDSFVARNEFFQDYSLPLGRRYLMAVKLTEAPSTSTIMAIIRSSRQGPYEAEQRDLLEHLYPHLQRVAQTSERVCRMLHEHQLNSEIIDHMRDALIVCDANASVVHLNQEAEAMVRHADGIRVVGGRLMTAVHQQTDRLHDLIRAATAIAAGQAAGIGNDMIIDGLSGSRYGITVVPLSPRAELTHVPGRPLTLIVISSLNQEKRPYTQLIHLFGLTPAEARLAAEVASGNRLETLAEEYQVTMPTLRTQMHAIFAKTGTARQAELAHLITSLPRIRR